MAPAVDHNFTNGHVHSNGFYLNGTRNNHTGDYYVDRAHETADVSPPCSILL